MKNTLLAGVCTAALSLVAPAASQAQDMSNGWYISMFGGLSVPEAMTGKFFVQSTLFSNIIGLNETDKLTNGFIVGLTVGKSITENIRGEVEFAFSRHKPKTATLATATSGGGGSFLTHGKEVSILTPFLATSGMISTTHLGLHPTWAVALALALSM